MVTQKSAAFVHFSLHFLIVIYSIVKRFILQMAVCQAAVLLLPAIKNRSFVLRFIETSTMLQCLYNAQCMSCPVVIEVHSWLTHNVKAVTVWNFLIVSRLISQYNTIENSCGDYCALKHVDIELKLVRYTVYNKARSLCFYNKQTLMCFINNVSSKLTRSWLDCETFQEINQ